MLAGSRNALLIGLGFLCLAVLLPGTVSVWMDEDGHTYLVGGASPPTPGAVRVPDQDLALSWGGKRTGPPLEGRTDSSGIDDRVTRELVAAREDIGTGEITRGLARLRRLQDANPGRPEIGLMLAEVERSRGRLTSAREAVEAALSVAAEMPEAWRQAALTLMRDLDEEIAFANSSAGGGIDTLDSQHFSITYDHDFAGRAYGARVLELLQLARKRVEQSMGRTLGRPLTVRLYTKVNYLKAHEHRFGFATVGFYDGVIHVVSARHPRRELYALLVHEYVHALFQDALGGHRPFFLNEGIAEDEEERARGRARLSRGEWRQLLEALRTGSWIRLSSLIEGFGALKGKRALLAYLESRAAVQMIQSAQPGALARWLDRCAEGAEWEEALRAETGWDTQGLESALKDLVRSRFPGDPLASLTPG
jgi:hypothetical protein